MTGLMVMFLLIAVCYMVRVEADADRVKTVAVAYSETRDALYEDLRREFSVDLPRWRAQLIKADLTIRFYLHNMELSQARTRSTLLYVLMLPQVRGEVDWLRRLVTANGLSSSRPILDASGKEDAARSRRVDFKIRTDAETRIAKILEVTR
jgi:hypothetical protein